MANFLDLPIAVRKKIYRLHLVRNEPITLHDHEKIVQFQRQAQRYFGPPILLLSRKLDHEAAPIYYSENEFDFADLEHDVWSFKHMTYPRHLRLVKKVTAYIDPLGESILESCRNLGKMKGLQQLRIGVDERAMLNRTRARRPTMQRHQIVREYGTERFGEQEQLSLLSFPGITGLLSLSGLSDFEFTDRQATACSKVSGPIPGGFLETQLLPRIRSAGKAVCNEYVHSPQCRSEVLSLQIKSDADIHSLKVNFNEGFPFLHLPPELRNIVYKLLFRFDGPLHPSRNDPTSSIAQRAYKRKSDRIETPNSALSLLAVNHQVRDEAVGLFYSNALVFYYPSQLGAFIMNLNSQRQGFIRDLTVYYQSISQGGIDIVDLAFLPLRQLSNLRRLHVIMNGDLNRKLDHSSMPRYHLRNANPALMPGMETLLQLRKLSDIKVRDLWLEEDIEKLKPKKGYPKFEKSGKDALRIKLEAALSHFNEALKLAQLGLVNAKLLENKTWQTEDVFPALK